MHAGAQADANVHAVADEVGVADAGGDAGLDIGVLRQEAVEARHQPLGGQAGRGADHQDAVLPAAAEPVQRLADRLEARLHAGKDEARRLGELDGTGAAVEQLEAQDLLQPADLMAERGRRHVQLLRRLGEA